MNYTTETPPASATRANGEERPDQDLVSSLLNEDLGDELARYQSTRPVVVDVSDPAAPDRDYRAIGQVKSVEIKGMLYVVIEATEPLYG